MAELDLDALEQAAREAGGGCWFSAGWTVGSRGFEVGDLKSRNRICSDATERCAEFIAAANPATILELLGRLKTAEKERDNANAAAAIDALQAIELESKLEVAEKTNRGWLRANATGGWIDNLRIENDTLRAKIDQLEEDTKAVILAANSGAQPTPSVPDGWLRAVDEALVTTHIGVANESDTYEQAKAKLDNLIGFHVDVATDPAVNGGYKLMPAEPTREIYECFTAYDGSSYSNPFDFDDFREDYLAAINSTGLPVGAKLYTLPGAQAMLRVPDAVMAAIENLDDYIARIEGNDRGACSHINLVRRYLLDAAGAEGNK